MMSHVAFGCVAFVGAAFVLMTTGESTARATVITVNAINTVTGDGKCSFDEALNALNKVSGRDACLLGNGNNDTISLPQNATPYNAHINGSINKPVTITGALASNTTLQFSSPDDYEVSLSLTGTGTVTFQNLTIQQSTASKYLSIGLANYGMTVKITGAILRNFFDMAVYNVSSFPTTITSSTLSNNGTGFVANSAAAATILGSTLSNNGNGFVSESGGTATITSSTFSNNAYSGIYDDYGTLSITNSTVSANGGGIETESAAMTITSSTVSSNAGWGIQAGGGVTMTNNCIVDGNGGGGVYMGGDSNIYGSTISNNGHSNPPQYGGGLSGFGRLDVSGSTIKGNLAYNGGGIYAGGTLNQDGTIGGVIVSGNSAYVDGGGIYLDWSAGAYFEGSGWTITGNSASLAGGGIYMIPTYSGTVASTYCTAKNSSPDISAPTNAEGTALLADRVGTCP